MDTLKFGYKFLRKSMPMAIFAEILSFWGIFAELLLPLLSGLFIDYVIKSSSVNGDSGGVFRFLLSGKYGKVHSIQLFFSIAMIYMGLVLIRIVAIYIRNLMQERVGLQIETALRYKSYEKLMELDSATIADYNSGELLQILNSDTTMLKSLFAVWIPCIGDAIFALVIILLLLAGPSPFLIIIPAVLIPFFMIAVREFNKKARDNFQDIRSKSSEMNLKTQENVAGVRIIRSFTNEKLEEEKFNKTNAGFCDARIKQVNLSAKFGLIFNSIRQITYISTIIIGAVLAMNGYLTIGYILTASGYVTQIMNYVTNLSNLIFNMQHQLVVGSELKKFMEKESQVPDCEVLNIRCDTPHIELKDVSLDIDGQKILKNINLSIPYGKKIGVVGETGSGKSVLLKTLVRTRDITSGKITIDGYDIKDFSLKKLRNLYSYVFQDVFLFSNTIESNIAFSKPDLDQRLVTATAGYAQANKFISDLPERYKTIIGERGLGISGGQKQRISIARAFYKNASVFILDDSTSALDVNTERTLLKDIHDNFSEKTVIIAAHRFSSVVDCDEIIYLKNGEITERGTFKQLMELDGSFARVYKVQQAQLNNASKKNGGGDNV